MFNDSYITYLDLKALQEKNGGTFELTSENSEIGVIGMEKDEKREFNKVDLVLRTSTIGTIDSYAFDFVVNEGLLVGFTNIVIGRIKKHAFNLTENLNAYFEHCKINEIDPEAFQISTGGSIEFIDNSIKVTNKVLTNIVCDDDYFIIKDNMIIPDVDLTKYCKTQKDDESENDVPTLCTQYSLTINDFLDSSCGNNSLLLPRIEIVPLISNTSNPVTQDFNATNIKFLIQKTSNETVSDFGEVIQIPKVFVYVAGGFCLLLLIIIGSLIIVLQCKSNGYSIANH